MASSFHRLRLILGDQLNDLHSWFVEQDDRTLYVIAELHEEATYVPHHVQKVCAFFDAMEAFAEHLKEAGHQVLHLTLDDTEVDGCVERLLTRLAKEYSVSIIEYQQPDEHRLRYVLSRLLIDGVTITECDSEHFVLAFDDLTQWVPPAKSVRMETFYRRIRVQQNVLMEGEKPVGGQWNFDARNRKRLKEKDLASIPAPLTFLHDVSPILERLKRHGIPTIGVRKTQLTLPRNRSESLQLLSYFCEQLLPRFGDFQDAMTERSDHGWSLYHSRLSFSLNTKMLHPLEVINAAIDAFHTRDDIDIAQVEGFVRQVLGWREFVRAVYWANMPEYKTMNTLDAKRSLPAYFWSGKTRMNCMAQTVRQSLAHGYAHHIQRLMVTGVFGLIAGINPDHMDEWYMGIYLDALEWVELPNTRGMSQFADGGIVSSKPYAASGNYINKMSDYCSSCHYDVKSKQGENACPFNALYWDFMHRHRDQLARNPRIGMIYGTWDRFDAETRTGTLERARQCLDDLSSL